MEVQPPTPSTALPTPPPHLNYPDLVKSSSCSHNTNSWDEPFALASSKLRPMCSYDGHIVQLPHDKSLCYVGSDTCIIVVERATSLADLSTLLSKTFLNRHPFTLKYQLPNEDHDSLISVTTDEDLENMIDKYDQTAAATSVVKPSKLVHLSVLFLLILFNHLHSTLLYSSLSLSFTPNALNSLMGFLRRLFGAKKHQNLPHCEKADYKYAQAHADFGATAFPR